MGAMDRHRVFAVALAFASVLSTAFADLASTYPMSELLDWERESQMQMSISGADGDVVPFIYSVVPLTGSDLGLNDTQRDGGVSAHEPTSSLPMERTCLSEAAN